MKTTIAIIFGSVVVALVISERETNSDLRAMNERIDHLQFEVKTLTHALGEVRSEAVKQPDAVITNVVITVWEQ